MPPRGLLHACPQASHRNSFVRFYYHTLFGSFTRSRREFRSYPARCAPGQPMKHTPGAPLALMPIGGSGTYGVGSSHGNGYRKSLFGFLQQHGLPVRMVGSRETGSMENNCHEGWRGQRIDQVEKKARRSVGKFLPDIFTVNAGSNDCLQSYEIGGLGKRMAEMLECLWSLSPGSTVILSTLIANADKDLEPQFEDANIQLRDLVEQMSGQRRKIVLADMRSPEGPDVDDLIADGTHPNDAGYDKMAMVWLNAILEAHGKGYLSEAS